MIAATRPVLAYIPSPDQGVWHVGPIPIRAYALCIIVGIIVAIWWAERRFVARGGQQGIIVDVAVWAVPFGLVGGRLYHVATDWWRYFGDGKNPVDALKIWDGGLGIPGAVILGGLGAWIACRRKGVPLPFVADSIAPALVTAQAIGRLGNYFNQELYGGPTTLPWGLEIFQRINPTTGATDDLNGIAVSHAQFQVVHPTFLYELLWDLLVAVLVVVVDRRLRLGHGRAFAVYVSGYAFGRFWIELLRSDRATMVFGVRINVWIMSLLFVGGIVYFLLAGRRGPREDATTFRGYVPAVEPNGVAPGDSTVDDLDNEHVSVGSGQKPEAGSSAHPPEHADEAGKEPADGS